MIRLKRGDLLSSAVPAPFAGGSVGRSIRRFFGMPIKSG